MILRDEADTARLGEVLASRLRAGDVITLSGPLGVGKTALVRALIRSLGFAGEVPSPTFAIVQPYDSLRPPLWHADLYRVEHPGELDQIGLDEILGDGVLLVEWPERAGNGRWPEALHLSLDFAPAGARRLTASVPPAWEARWPCR